ncbi:uncharacterized protein IL334_001088 [Kwoniella shivajii]|uniref:Extracellular membrane protein CFEM domain-containing protein n=1 Tax=Kwoniella shivajii TaxID=564305 RepID=A0ABZ1CSK2_9TREE|nr:hypothetical protein IL334_001088 [Kwoniella shivajii]
MNGITRLLYVLCSIFLIPFTIATAASQFHLDLNRDSSKCFIECHQRVVNTIQIPGTGTNAFAWIHKNCEYDTWKTLLSQCLPVVCTSAPDVAYAIEYGQHFCSRAGVDVIILLTEEYAQSANGSYFKSEEYLAASSGEKTMFTMGIASVFALSAIAVLFLVV